MNISSKTLDSGLKIYYFPNSEFTRLNPSEKKQDFDFLRFGVRLNALSMIKVAGSGHVGSSLSAVDLFVSAKLFYLEENINKTNNSNGILFSSKGHDAPGLYSVLHAFGEIPDESIFSLRKLNGLPGHPEVGVANVPTNTGSLGMGISKAKGFSYAYNLKNQSEKKIAVVLGDGELQEGQIWESLPGASRDNLGNILAIVDGNKIQSDTWVEKTLPLGDLRMRTAGSGWEYLECDGHDFDSLKKSMQLARRSRIPVFLYAHTVKSSGIDFMETFHPDGNFYKYHSGSPTDDEYYSGILSILKQLTGISEEKILEISNLISVNQLVISEDFKPKNRNPSLILDWNESLLR
jgi:transketolase